VTFVARLAETLNAAGERVVLFQDVEGDVRELTGPELLARAGAFRAGFQARGVEAGARVGLVAANSADWVACDLAALAEGIALVPLDPRQAPAERAQVLADAQPSLVVGPDPAAAGEHPAATFAELGAEASPWAPPRAAEPGDLATIIYTSGSSGEPKGAMLSRGNLDFMLARTEARLAELTGLEVGQERALHYLPLCYAGSRILLLSCLLRGARLHLLADPKRLGDALGQAQADYLLNVPLVLERFQRAATTAVEGKGAFPASLLHGAIAAWDRREEGKPALLDGLRLGLARSFVLNKIRGRFGDRLKGIICGSAPLAVSTQRFFRMLGVDVYQGYGLTETTALCTLDVLGKIQPGWVGPALDGVEMRASDEGEILTRGPHIFLGYWERPEATKAAFVDEDPEAGWFRTGDLGDVDGEGRWRITGRASAVLVLSTGHNVAPEPVEAALRDALTEVDPAQADAQVIVLGHGRKHLVALFAPPALAEDPQPVPPHAAARAVEVANAHLSPKQKVFAHACLDEAFTIEGELLTANMKLKRKAIAARHADAIDALYAQEPARA
jgi:long-chain acyl-CoA synthetase